MSGSDLSRRTVLRGAAAVTAGAAVLGATPAAAAEPALRVYIVVVDGLSPDEVAQMPQLRALAAAGTHFPASRAQMIAETTPNHVSMITGVRADGHGMPGNDVILPSGEVVEIGSRPELLAADSLFTLARRQAPELVTASVLGKEYLVNMAFHDRTGDGEPDVTYNWQPPAFVPISQSVPDQAVMDEALRVSRELDPALLFVSLGDVDRVGHSDGTGALPTGLPPAGRTIALQTADVQLRRLVTQLQSDGRWASTVVLFSADHSMDWSLPNRIVSLSPAFEADPQLAGRVIVAQNGGAAMYALRGPDGATARDDALLARMRAIAVATPGVSEALYTAPNRLDGGRRDFVGAVHPDWGLTGDRTGHLLVFVADGWRVTEPQPVSNPIPGNHGHTVTLPLPVIVSGGWPGLRRGVVVEPRAGLAPTDRDRDQAETIDIAPTAAWLLGLSAPTPGFTGRVLREAFTRRPAPAVTRRPR